MADYILAADSLQTTEKAKTTQLEELVIRSKYLFSFLLKECIFYQIFQVQVMSDIEFSIYVQDYNFNLKFSRKS